MPGLEKKLLQEQLENHQIQRHDFLNIFQVIRGYIQLNMPKKALEYLDEEIAGLQPQQEIDRIGDQSMHAILLGWYYKLRLKGIKIDIIIPSEMKRNEFWLGRWQEEYAQHFYGYTITCVNEIPLDGDPEDFVARIRLDSLSGGFSCDFSLLKNENSYFHRLFTTADEQS